MHVLLHRSGVLAVTGALLLAPFAVSMSAVSLVAATAASAQTQAANLGGVGESDMVSVRAKVMAIDMPRRQVTLNGPSGEFVVHAGDSVRDLDKVAVGDMVVARYYGSVTYVLSSGNGPAPDPTVTTDFERARLGALPGAAAARKLVVSGLVVSIDQAAHTIQLVAPNGGQVQSVHVTDPERQKQMMAIKVGDTITAVVTEALAVNVDPV